MAGISQLFVPKEREFFDLFEEAAANLVRGAKLLEDLLHNYPEKAHLTHEILVCEQEGDRITHDIINRLNQSFVTPIDREDIYELATALDDIIDYTEEAADFLGLYKIERPTESSKKLARIISEATKQVAGAMPRMRKFKDISHYTVEINRLENDGDRVTRDALASLFDNGADPLMVIRWKDITERLEAAIDATEHVADLLSSIVIKNS